MHHATPLITTIVGGLVLAFILGMLANKLRISPLVGYLLAGVLAGPFTPGFVADTKLAPELAELGVILLMFGVGLHFSLKDLMAVKAIAIPGAIAQIAVATLLGMALSAVLGWSLMTGIVFGLCLSTASTVVLLRALEERQLIDSQRGQIAIGWLIVEDLVMVLTLVLLPAVAGMMEQGDVGFATLAVDMGITIGKVIAFIAIMMLVGRRLVPWIMSRSAATGSRELFTLSVLALALGIAFIPSYARVIRGEFARQREMNYVKNARLMGASHLRIMLVHILPNTRQVLLPTLAIGFNNAVLAEASMSFLGIGVKPPEVSLGYMMSESQSYMVRAPWYMLTCGSVIVLLILGVSLIGEGLQQKKWGR